jgi:hypothetical protein
MIGCALVLGILLPRTCQMPKFTFIVIKVFLMLDIPILIGDMTMIKTAARVWPTVAIMNGSTIMEKQSYIDYLKK